MTNITKIKVDDEHVYEIMDAEALAGIEVIDTGLVLHKRNGEVETINCEFGSNIEFLNNNDFMTAIFAN